MEIIIAIVSAIVAGFFGLASVWYEHYLDTSEPSKSAVTEVSQQNSEALPQIQATQNPEAASRQNQNDSEVDNEVDNKELFHQLKERSSQRDVKAQFELAEMYIQGKGTTKDITQAIKWYRKAANRGEVQAQLKLADMHFKGKDVVQNVTKAIKWYSRAAQKGNVKAQFRLGRIYEKGKGGVEKDLAQAREWYHKAAEQGHKKAKKKLEQLQN
ncbi:tetratricopeptide repeat protein [Candidatus Parabeggiatoa sp. HSG14]|uniref:tetratricopeptide repeat protein n=1 Tax=Candidatus Parabeggiatoa sp. HSG14 TaxID=3055593 RepID=UPI0025A769DD|nr:tetratricopeptide repeat protein [Thiotrichales bacterium HSG14]